MKSKTILILGLIAMTISLGGCYGNNDDMGSPGENEVWMQNTSFNQNPDHSKGRNGHLDQQRSFCP